ncbi:MAG TPA: protein kinase [Gemmatimonadales bacterium]|nr:protein kinase [Gemmatimonadales bacterium]
MTDLLERLIQHAGSRYRIERELGRGGMAIVYLALDLRHHRQVALKVMHPAIALALGADRFLREIQIAARLTHPRIVAVFDSGEADGVLYYIMPFIDALTLRQRLEQQAPLPVREAVGIARDVARALAHAHAHGVIHRDVKPENIMLPGGEAVVTDFGIARMLDPGAAPQLTEVGVIVGTPRYMSPEQAAGSFDDRADVYSLGCVLYEMLVGHPPFAGNTPFAVLSRHAAETPPSVRTGRPDVPPWLEAVVVRTLAKEPEQRPRASEVQAELDPGSRDLTTGPLAGQPPPLRTVAVLPFADLSSAADHGYLCDGIAEELLDALSRVSGIRVVSRTSSFALREAALDVREKARRVGADAVLEGSLRTAGDRLRIGVQFTNARDGIQLWSRRFEGSTGEVFAIEDQITRAVVEALRPQSDTPVHTLVRGPTANLEAYRLYLRGRQALNRRTEAAFEECIAHLASAAALDPRFAMVQVALAEAHLLLGVYGARPAEEVIPRTLAAAERALELMPGLAEALAARATVRAVYQWDWTEAERDFLAALQRHPVPASGRLWYANYLLVPLGRFAEAREQLEEAQRLDPLSPSVSASLGQAALFGGDFEGAIAYHRTALDLAPGFAPAHHFLGQALIEAGRIEEAIATLERAAELSDRSPDVLPALAGARARAGAVDQAEALLQELADRSSDHYVSPLAFAITLLGLGRTAAALDALEQAAAVRAAGLVWLAVRPTFAVLAGEPRYRALLDRLGLNRTARGAQPATEPAGAGSRSR